MMKSDRSFVSKIKMAVLPQTIKILLKGDKAESFQDVRDNVADDNL